MTTNDLITIQSNLGLSDGKMAISLGVTRQTFRNWRTGKACPVLAQNAIKWMMELRRIEPSNDNLPQTVRVKL